MDGIKEIGGVRKSIGDFMTEMPKVPRLARPWDMFNKNIGRVEDTIQKERMSICNDCPYLIKLTKQCSKCGCFMEAKTRLPHASCPEGKWDAVNIDENKISYKED